MIGWLAGLAIAGAALWFSGCAPRKGPKTSGLDADKEKRGNVIDESVIIEAGGWQSFLMKNMKPDGRFRVYTMFVEGCSACEKMDDVMDILQSNYRGIDYQKIDIMTFEELPYPTEVPLSIIQYSDCETAKIMPGWANESYFRRVLFSLKHYCEENQAAQEEDLPSCTTSPIKSMSL